jgi:hypothetical protein
MLLKPCHQTIINLMPVSTAVTQTLSLPIDFETLAGASVLGVGTDGATTMVVEGPYIGGTELISAYYTPSYLELLILRCGPLSIPSVTETYVINSAQILQPSPDVILSCNWANTLGGEDAGRIVCGENQLATTQSFSILFSAYPVDVKGNVAVV